jgi:rod shape-determining protein MreC
MEEDLQLFVEEGHRLKLILNFVVLGFSLFGISTQNLVYNKTTVFENLMIDSFAPMQRSVSFINKEVSDFFEHYVLNVDASQENEGLKTKVKNLENKIFSFKEIKEENKRLKDLLEFKEAVNSKKILAQIVAWDSASDFKTIRINKGINHGVKLQSTVVTADGLVGYIFRITNNFSDILTILSPSNRVDGLVERVRTHGIIEGYSASSCFMKYVNRTEPIILNDVVITSGLGNVYPKGVKIGNITVIERESYGITQSVEITPSVDFSRLEEVIVLVSEGRGNIKKEWSALDEIDEANK